MARLLPADCKAEVHYVALGDSTVAGVGGTSRELSYPARLARRLQRVYPRTRLTNLGLGGALAPDVVDFQLGRTIAMQPQLVTLSIGPNDVTDAEPLEVYAEAVATVFAELARATEAVMVVNTIPDMSLATRFHGEEKVRVGRDAVRFNERLREAASAHDVEVVDLYAPSRALGDDYVELLSPDGYHPNDTGYEKWAELMWLGLEKRLGCRAGA